MIDITKFLKSFNMIGKIWPVSETDSTEPVMALLVPVGTAMDEYIGWSGQEPTRTEFINALREQGIQVFNSLEDFLKYRDNLKILEKVIKQNKKKVKRNISEERRNQLKEHVISIRSKIRPSTSQND